MKRTRILVTGGSGFVGSTLVMRLADFLSCDVVAVVRSSGFKFPSRVIECKVGSLSRDTDYRNALTGGDVVVHSAARVHVMNDQTSDPQSMFRMVNVEGTLNLARQAADLGVKRFVFLSSIKVNGEGGSGTRPFTVDDIPNPTDSYGISKFEAEAGLHKISESSGMEIVIIRPPLVYGGEVKENFQAMMSRLHRGISLPLDNFVDLIRICLEHPSAANEIFLVSDGQDLSTTELLHHLARSLGTPARLILVHVWLMRIVTVLLQSSSLSTRLFDSLQVDITRTKNLLGWSPPVDVNEALYSTAQHFLREHK